ncbi:Tetratricopeptide repeat protein 39B [Sparganum proliferum]
MVPEIAFSSLRLLVGLEREPLRHNGTSGEEASALTEARLMLNEWSNLAARSAIFLFLAGRLQLLTGNFDPAEELFFQSIRSQSDFTNYHHICYWELMWCYCVQGKWLQAMKYAERLACESKWSQATYRYLKAALIMQFMEEEARAGSDVSADRFSALKDRRLTPVSLSGYVVNKETPTERDVTEDADGGTMALHVEKLLEGVPQMVQRIAGKSLPIEKFAMRKSKRYFEQGKRLTLPGLELMYLWNGFKLVYNKADVLEKFLLLVEFKLNRLLAEESNYKYFADDFCLATMLKGICLRCLGRQMQAKMCFMEVIMNAKKIQVDTYLLPFSEVELCQISLDEGDRAEAKKHLEAAWNYRGYSLEARLHFRLHAISLALKAKKNDISQDVNATQPSPIASMHEGLSDVAALDNDNPFEADDELPADDPNEIITFGTTGQSDV